MRHCQTKKHILYKINRNNSQEVYFGESKHSGILQKKGVLKNSAIFTGQHLFSCEYWEIFKNTYFEEHLRTAASERIQQQHDH